MAQRAIVFVDGSNWYHGLKAAGVSASGAIDYVRLCTKLVGPARQWLGLRWYVGQVIQTADRAELYRDQRRFLDQLRSQDSRISIHLGRVTQNTAKNDAAQELERYLGGLRSRLEPEVYGALYDIARRHRTTAVYTEKEVDVMVAVDMVTMATNDQYDVAYLLSADGDYAPAVRAVMSSGKVVFPVHPKLGYELCQACTPMDPTTGKQGKLRGIKVTPDWLRSCFQDPPVNSGVRGPESAAKRHGSTR